MNRHASPIQVIPLTPIVKWLIFLTVGVWFFLQVIVEGFFKFPLTSYFSLRPDRILFEGFVWQVFTYIFLHSLQVTHILFNMLMLWFFGSELEQRWGSRFFLSYYLVCGVGAGILYVLGMALYALVSGHTIGLRVPVIGASGAIFGLLFAYGKIFGERIVHVFMVFPMKAKYFVMIMGVVEFLSMMTASQMGDEVAYLAHLGGLLTGFLYLWTWGHTQRFLWNRKMQQKHKGRNLRLVVDNEKNEKGAGPKYWN